MQFLQFEDQSAKSSYLKSGLNIFVQMLPDFQLNKIKDDKELDSDGNYLSDKQDSSDCPYLGWVKIPPAPLAHTLCTFCTDNAIMSGFTEIFQNIEGYCGCI